MFTTFSQTLLWAFVREKEKELTKVASHVQKVQNQSEKLAEKVIALVILRTMSADYQIRNEKKKLARKRLKLDSWN